MRKNLRHFMAVLPVLTNRDGDMYTPLALFPRICGPHRLPRLNRLRCPGHALDDGYDIGVSGGFGSAYTFLFRRVHDHEQRSPLQPWAATLDEQVRGINYDTVAGTKQGVNGCVHTRPYKRLGLGCIPLAMDGEAEIVWIDNRPSPGLVQTCPGTAWSCRNGAGPLSRAACPVAPVPMSGFVSISEYSPPEIW